MPELPEVETIRKDLESDIVGLKFTKVDFLWPGSLKGTSIEEFKKIVIGSKITGIRRRAKNLSIDISNNHSLLMHMKMTGHLLLEPASQKFTKDGKWINGPEALKDPLNQFIRVIFWLDNGKILAFSDLRKFGYIKLLDKESLDSFFDTYGPEPFSANFNIQFLQTLFAGKKQAIKKVLMDQSNIAGIGNIYADEILWETCIHPETPANTLDSEQIKNILGTTQTILKKAVELRGTSTSDYRDTKGAKGRYEEELKAYRQNGAPCSRCGTVIEKIVVGGRGTHFCPNCQKKESL